MFNNNNNECKNGENECIENIEKILRQYEQNDSILIYNIKCSPGSRLGDNYMSVVKRVKVFGKYNGDEVYYRRFIVKRQIASISRRELFRCNEAFSNEISAYCNVASLFQAYSRLPYPKCIYAGYDEQGDVVMLEDLCASGYQMVDRRQGLDYNHCRLVMEELGSFHAVSIAMRYKNAVEFSAAISQIQEIVYCPDAVQFYTHSLETSLRDALISLNKSNKNGDLTEIIQKIEKLTGKMYNQMAMHVTDTTTNKWNVVCHGDLWINNLMFKYDRENNINDNSSLSTVCGVKLIDLQTVRYASPIIDILHFFYSSTRRSLRDNYLDQLLSDYLRAFLNELWRHLNDCYPEALRLIENEFTLNYIKEQFNAKIMYGLGTIMWLLPAITFHPDNIPDLDAVTMSDFTNSNVDKQMTQMLTEDYHIRMKETMLEFEKKNYFQSIF